MKYKVEMSAGAEKELKSLGKNIAIRIGEKLLQLEENFHPAQSIKLQSSPFYRIRVGDYRVVSHLNKNTKIIRIIKRAHRREAYR